MYFFKQREISYYPTNREGGQCNVVQFTWSTKFTKEPNDTVSSTKNVNIRWTSLSCGCTSKILIPGSVFFTLRIHLTWVSVWFLIQLFWPKLPQTFKLTIDKSTFTQLRAKKTWINKGNLSFWLTLSYRGYYRICTKTLLFQCAGYVSMKALSL